MAILFLLIIVSCGSNTASQVEGESIALRHSTLLSMTRQQDGTVLVHVANPWKAGKNLHQYALVQDAGIQVPQGYTVVQIPLRRAVVFTSVHLALINELECMGQVAGVCDKQYIKLPSASTLPDLGSSMAPDIERLVQTNPDALLVSPFENGGYGQMEKLSLPIIECADYMEPSPLARAEWMRFYGLLFGVDTEEKFDSIEAAYNALKRPAVGRTLFTDQLSGQAWYVPGGQSYLGLLFTDAGADYIFGSNKDKGSVALSFETVFSKARKANLWLIKYNAPHDLTLNELEKGYPPYREFDAFKNRNIYGCNTGRVNYYEETCFHPERLLHDIEIVLDGNDGLYYQRLK